MERFQLELIYLYFAPSSHLVYLCFCPSQETEVTSTPTRPVDNVIATKGLQDRNINIIAGTTVENKGKLITPNVEDTRSTVKRETVLKMRKCFNKMDLSSIIGKMVV